MKIRKIISALSAVTIALALTGCQNTSPAPSVPVVDVGSQSSQEESTASTVTSTSTETSTSTTSTAGTSTETSIETSSTSAEQPVVDRTGQQGEISGSVLVAADGRGMPIFGGGTGTTYATSVNAVKEKVGANVNVFSMVIPTQGSFYMPEGFSMASEWDCIANINSQLNGIIPVDAYTALSKHVDEEIYARTDHHWMQLGAYYAAEEFVKTAKISVPFAPLSDYERHDIEGYLGTLYAFSDDNATMGANPETFTYYVSPNDFTTYYMNPEDVDFASAPMFLQMDVSQSYCIFMGGDRKVVHVDTDVTNSRKLLIIKDSYANALVPCLTGSFEDIWVVDMRYLEKMQHFPNSISQIVKDYGITDVLFCMDTFSAVGENAVHLPGII